MQCFLATGDFATSRLAVEQAMCLFAGSSRVEMDRFTPLQPCLRPFHVIVNIWWKLHLKERATSHKIKNKLQITQKHQLLHNKIKFNHMRTVNGLLYDLWWSQHQRALALTSVYLKRIPNDFMKERSELFHKPECSMNLLQSEIKNKSKKNS